MDELILRNMESAQYVYAAKKNFKLENAISESNTNLFFAHFSDMHSDLPRFENAIKLMEYFGAEFAVHTGDSVCWDMQDNSAYFIEGAKRSKVPLYNCVGNHDTSAGERKLPNEEIFERLIPLHDNMNTESKRGYYYADFEKKSLRLIVLNAYDFDDCSDKRRETYSLSQTQCEWLVKSLQEASKKGYAVIIAAHEGDTFVQAGANDYGFCQRFHPQPWGEFKPHGHLVADIVDAFKHGKTLAIDHTWAGTEQKVKFTAVFEGKGEFICYINGHYHADLVGYLPEYPDQLSIHMPPSSCFPKDYHNIGEELSDLPRIPNTVSEDLINFYGINRTKKTVSIVRVGATVNDLMEKRQAIVLPYEGIR